MTAFLAFFQAIRQGIVAKWGVLKSTGKPRMTSNTTTPIRNSKESVPRAAGTQASAVTKKKTIDDWDYEVVQLITAWH
jgi:hypothetical protein